MKIDLQGQVTVITGGAKGIGLGIATAFAQAGSDLIILGRDTAALDTATQTLRSYGVRADAIAADITDETALQALARLVESEYGGRVDAIVTCAGTRDHMALPVSDLDMAQFDAVMQGNLNGSLLPIRAVLPFMKARQHGKVITISGVFGFRGKANHGAGCASKWALEGLVRVLALELGSYNINVNSICPGYVEGPRSAAGLARNAEKAGTTAEALRQKLVDATALKRLSTPEDIAHAALFLASDYARNITGQDIVIDAGWTL